MMSCRARAMYCLLASTLAAGFVIPFQLGHGSTARSGSMRMSISQERSVSGGLPLMKWSRYIGYFSLAALGIAPLGGVVMGPQQARADGSTTRFSLPPIDQEDKTRCQFKSSTIGQANAARDKLYDLRQCDLSDLSAPGFDLSGAIMSEARFKKVNFKDAVLSKAYAKGSDFEGADFTNAIVDRVTFEGSNLRGAIFANAVLSGTNFAAADLHDSDFTDAYLGEFDLRSLCRNPTLEGTNPKTGVPTKESVGCK